MEKEKKMIHEPAAERKGKWKFGEMQEFFTIIDYAYCSECKCKQNPEQVEDFNFCPNCGADMRGEKRS